MGRYIASTKRAVGPRGRGCRDSRAEYAAGRDRAEDAFECRTVAERLHQRTDRGARCIDQGRRAFRSRLCGPYRARHAKSRSGPGVACTHRDSGRRDRTRCGVPRKGEERREFRRTTANHRRCRRQERGGAIGNARGRPDRFLPRHQRSHQRKHVPPEQLAWCRSKPRGWRIPRLAEWLRDAFHRWLALLH